MLAQLNPSDTQRRLDNEHKARLAKLWPVLPPRIADIIEIKGSPKLAAWLCVEPDIPEPVKVEAPIIVIKRSTHPVVRVQYAVAAHFQITRADVLNKSRKKYICHIRQIAMFMARECAGHSQPDIGKRFGGYDHTTVFHAHRKTCVRAVHDFDFAYDLAELELKVREALQ